MLGRSGSRDSEITRTRSFAAAARIPIAGTRSIIGAALAIIGAAKPVTGAALAVGHAALGRTLHFAFGRPVNRGLAWRRYDIFRHAQKAKRAVGYQPRRTGLVRTAFGHDVVARHPRHIRQGVGCQGQQQFVLALEMPRDRVDIDTGFGSDLFEGDLLGAGFLQHAARRIEHGKPLGTLLLLARALGYFGLRCFLRHV